MPPIAWLIPLAALLAVISAFLPWFKPKLAGTGPDGAHQAATFSGLYSFKDGQIGLLAPVLLVILAILVIRLLRGRSPLSAGRRMNNPVRTVGILAAVFGLLSIISVGVAILLVKSQYKFTVAGTGQHLKWNQVLDFERSLGFTNLSLSRNPQPGIWLTLVAGVIALVAGIVLLIASARKPAAVTPGIYAAGPGAAPQPGQPPFGAQPAQYPGAAPGYPQPGTAAPSPGAIPPGAPYPPNPYAPGQQQPPTPGR